MIETGKLILKQACNQMGGKGEVSPALFLKLEKSALILGKNALIVVIFVINFSSKVQLLGVSRRKNWRFFPAGPFFFVLQIIIYQYPLIPKNSPAQKNSWLHACEGNEFQSCWIEIINDNNSNVSVLQVSQKKLLG